MTTALPYSLQDVIDCFPFPSYRQHQREVIEQVYDRFSTGVRAVLLEAPTGFGKSPVNMAFALAEEKAFYLTPLKQLQNQVADEFVDHELYVIKGRSNYRCKLNPLLTCNIGKCMLHRGDRDFECPYKSGGGCEYWDAKRAAMQGHIALSNFDYMLSDAYLRGSFAPRFGERPLLLVDEGHSIAEKAVNFVSVTLSRRTLPESVRDILKLVPNGFDSFDDVRDWLVEPRSMVEERRVSLEGILMDYSSIQAERRLDKAEQEKFEAAAREIERLQSLVYKLDEMNYDRDTDNWIWDITPENNHRKAEFRPVTAGRFLERLLWWRAGGEGRIIISSATILDAELFARDAGLPEPYSLVQVPSTFPVSHRSIVKIPCGKMTYYLKEKTLPKLLRTLYSILEKEKGHRGIIHCHSYENLEHVRKALG